MKSHKVYTSIITIQVYIFITSKCTCPIVQESMQVISCHCLFNPLGQSPQSIQLLYTYLYCLLQLPIPKALQSPMLMSPVPIPYLLYQYLVSCIYLTSCTYLESPMPVLYLLLSYSQSPMPIQLPCLYSSAVLFSNSPISTARHARATIRVALILKGN